MLTFRMHYFILTVLIFLTELFIALFVHDKFIRPNIGDFLVVILIYCFVRSFLNISVTKAAVAVLLFAYTIEFLQYLKIVEVLGLQHSKLARIIIGTSFSWGDMLAYTLGIVLVLIIERYIGKRSLPKKP